MASLSVYNFGGVRFGVRDDPDGTVLDVAEIHWLSPDPPWLAGLTVLSGRTFTLFDLPAGLGLAPTARGPGRYRIVCRQNGPAAGLLVSEQDRSEAGQSSRLETLPDFLLSETVAEFLVQHDKPVPVVDCAALLRQLVRPEFRPRGADCRLAVRGTASGDPPETFSAVSIGGEPYAISTTHLNGSGLRSALECIPFQPSPSFLPGICWDGRRVIPLIDPANRLTAEVDGKPPVYLDVCCGGRPFRFLVDAVGAVFEDLRKKPLPLPPLLQTEWRPSAVIDASELYPVLDFEALLSMPPDAPLKTINPGAYSVTDRFGRLFQHAALEVLEFDLNGTAHALPAVEAGEPFAALPFRSLPVSNPLVVGVAESNGLLLPVLDLGACFGLRPRSEAERWMIPVQNGDFRALVLTSHVYGLRRLELEEQRQLPFERTEDLVYGCYPHQDTVRLIFNTHSLAVFFDAARHVRILASLAAGGAGAAATARGDETENVATLREIPLEDAGRSPVDCAQPPARKPAPARESCPPPERAPKPEPQAPRDQPDAAGDEPALTRLENRASVQAAAQASAGDRQERLPAVCGPRLPAIVEPQRCNRNRTARGPVFRLVVAFQEGLRPDSEFTLPRALPPPEVLQSEAEKNPAGSITGGGENALTAECGTVGRNAEPESGQEDRCSRKSALPPHWFGMTDDEPESEVLAADFRESGRRVSPLPDPQNDAAAEGTAADRDLRGAEIDSDDGGELLDFIDPDAVEEVPPLAAAVGAESDPGSELESPEELPDPQGELPLCPEAVPDDGGVDGRLRRTVMATLLVLLTAAAAAYFGGESMLALFFDSRPTVMTPLPASEAAPDAPAPLDAVSPQKPSADRTAVSAETDTGAQRQKDAIDFPMQIRITGKDGKTRVYEVKRGDTLWGISERYTGSGFNYPEVARENRIANPDLIFPDQKIKVKE